jgi:ABC-type Mn2+/Zn2+ transport system ATPase subunit
MLKLKSDRAKQACAHEGDAVVLQDLTLRYAQDVALNALNLVVKSGERIAVVGPNAAGKSSLFHILSGVVPPTSGHASVHGHPPARYLCTAYLPQSRQLDWNFPLTVNDVVMMGRAGSIGFFNRPQSEDLAAVDQAMQMLKISDLAQHPINQLSGGQRQRMFIARALAQEAQLLLLDEPLSSLDLGSQELIFDVLDELKKRQITVLLATHDLNLALERFDRVLLLQRELIGYGTAEEVLNDENLHLAYDGHVHLLQTPEGPRILGDMGGHHPHGEQDPHA